MCTQSAMAGARVMRRRPSTGGWPRSRACSGTGRCGTRLRRTRFRAARRPGGRPVVSAAACWPTWVSRSGARACGSASRGGCPGAWIRVTGKGGKERRVPLDPDVAGLIQAYLLAERPETVSRALFAVAKGPHRGQPLTAAGLRTIFRYHRGKAGVPAGHPHALRHSFGTALAEAGVDLAVLQALMGHDHVDSSAAYIHLAPAHVRAAYDAARQRQRAL